jgi:tRNA(Ile2) C34 agmatinyltransferase TiaS
MKRCEACGKLMIEAGTCCRECARKIDRAATKPNVRAVDHSLAPMLAFVIRQMEERAHGEAR